MAKAVSNVVRMTGPSLNVIEVLEEMLSRAKSGELAGIGWCGVTIRGTIFSGYGYDECNSFLLLAGASRLLHILNRDTE